MSIRRSTSRRSHTRHLGSGQATHVKEHKIKIHRTSGYARQRIQDPSKFQKGTFRTVDIGQAGGHKAVMAKKRGSDKLEVQSLLHPREEPAWQIKQENEGKWW